MIKNLSYPVPTIGRIAIGEKVEHKGKMLPKKLDHFVITTQVKNKGAWIAHPISEQVAKKVGEQPAKLRTIPIKLLFNRPELNIRSRYEAFCSEGRTICAGNGEQAIRRDANGALTSHPCPGADTCNFGKAVRCSLMTRLNVQIDVGDEKAATPNLLNGGSTFILRTGGFNTSRTLEAKLTSFAALFGGNLIGVPFALKLRSKTTAMSKQSIFHYVDIVPAVPLLEAAQIGHAVRAQMEAAGMHQEAYETVVSEGIENGPFEDSSEDFAEALEYVDFAVSDDAFDSDDCSQVEDLAAEALNKLKSYVQPKQALNVVGDDVAQ